MKRHRCEPREKWRDRVESLGLNYHSHEDRPYWDESACYELIADEVDALERAANTVHALCIEAADAVIKRNWWDRLAIPSAAIESIRQSWERDDFSLYGRFDLSFDGMTPPKLLEYNADTPTAILESAVVQWFWLQDTRPGADQFNSLHERLIDAWRRWVGKTIHFSSVKDHAEDEQTVLYLRDTCQQAGVNCQSIYVEDIGWDPREHQFVDLDLKPINYCFKLYPWEWMWREEFGKHLVEGHLQFIEPAWKMLLSNKALLPILWQLFPEHPNLLPAFDVSDPLCGNYIRKPKLSREGVNVRRVEGGAVIEETGGNYGEEGFVYQAIADVPEFGGNHPIFGVWVVDHEAAGLGIREDASRITTNLSRFVPHFFK